MQRIKKTTKLEISSYLVGIITAGLIYPLPVREDEISASKINLVTSRPPVNIFLAISEKLFASASDPRRDKPPPSPSMVASWGLRDIQRGGNIWLN